MVGGGGEEDVGGGEGEVVNEEWELQYGLYDLDMECTCAIQDANAVIC